MVLLNDTVPLRVPYALGVQKHKIKTYLCSRLRIELSFPLTRQNPSRCGAYGVYHYTAQIEQSFEAKPTVAHDSQTASSINVYFKDIDTTVVIPFAMARGDYAIKVAQEIGKVKGNYVTSNPDELYTRGTTIEAFLVLI